MNEKKERCSGAGIGYCPFFLSLSHNTASCIMTQGLTGMAWETGLGTQGRAGARKGKQGGAGASHDTAW